LTLKGLLVAVVPPLVMVIVSPWNAFGMLAVVLETPLTKFEGVAGEIVPEVSDQVAGPL
jgi:hypothetical protein